MEELKPAFKQNKTVIVFSIDNSYVPYLGVALTSLAANSNPDNFYDIVIFIEKISEPSRRILVDIFKGRKNFSLRFFDISGYIQNHRETLYVNSYFSVAIYYRIFIPEIFSAFDRALYLDSDMIFNADLAELAETDLEGKLLAVVNDFGVLPEYQQKNNHFYKYIEQILKMKNYRHYFNSGMLVMDIKKLKKMNITKKCLQKIKELPDLKFPDQDLLNVMFEGEVRYLDKNWNFQSGGLINTPEQIPEDLCPQIVHYTSEFKPWNTPEIPFGILFWRYARQCDFYEQIVYLNTRELALQNLKLAMRRFQINCRYFAAKLGCLVTQGKLYDKINRLKKQYKNQLKKVKKLLAL